MPDVAEVGRRRDVASSSALPVCDAHSTVTARVPARRGDAGDRPARRGEYIPASQPSTHVGDARANGAPAGSDGTAGGADGAVRRR